MDDFAQSREPDDLFSDDIEPTDPQVIDEKVAPAPTETRNEQVHIPHPPQPSRARGANHNNRGTRRGAHNNGLSSSAHATPSPATTQAPQAQSVSISPKPQDEATITSPPPAKLAPDEIHTASVRGDRSATGPAKPTKKTEAELSALMKSMQLKNAAKSEAHARAEKDQASFLQREQQAQAKRLEERKAIREQDMERARNRERKIKSQGGREWDSEKVESDVVDGKGKGSSSMYSRGAHGGISGGARGGGLAGSRYGGQEDGDDDLFSGRGARGGRGRGRGDFQSRGDGTRGGRGGRGRGGRGNIDAKSPPPIAADTEFPALPTKLPAVATTATAKPDIKESVLSPSAEADWADEMATPIEKP